MEWQYDKRVLDRNINKGIITSKDVDKRLKGLPDLADQVVIDSDDDEGDEDQDQE